MNLRAILRRRAYYRAYYRLHGKKKPQGVHICECGRVATIYSGARDWICPRCQRLQTHYESWRNRKETCGLGTYIEPYALLLPCSKHF